MSYLIKKVVAAPVHPAKEDTSFCSMRGEWKNEEIIVNTLNEVLEYLDSLCKTFEDADCYQIKPVSDGVYIHLEPDWIIIVKVSSWVL